METLKRNVHKIIAFILPIFMVAIAYAQKAELDVNVNKGGDAWYASPVVWIIGAAIFILLLVALLRGNGSKD